MASPERQFDSSLNDRIRESLQKEGHRYLFFAAVHQLHRLRRDTVPVGELGPAGREAVHFRQAPGLVFHAGDIEGIEFKEGQPPLLTSTFLGLYGSASPLALHFSEEVIRAEAADEHTLRAFYDLFHHRMISLYYRAWKKYRLQSGFRLSMDDPASRRMQCFVGVDGHGAAAETGLTKLQVLGLAPLLAMRSRSPRVLKLALARLLPNVEVEVEPFVLRRAKIDLSDRMQLGVRNNCLGTDTTLGSHVQDRSARFRLTLGPVGYDHCQALMPGGEQYPVLRRAIEQFTRGTLECEVDVLLEKEASTGYQLGNRRGCLLGVSTRLGHLDDRARQRMRTLISNDPREARVSLIEELSSA